MTKTQLPIPYFVRPKNIDNPSQYARPQTQLSILFLLQVYSPGPHPPPRSEICSFCENYLRLWWAAFSVVLLSTVYTKRYALPTSSMHSAIALTARTCTSAGAYTYIAPTAQKRTLSCTCRHQHLLGHAIVWCRTWSLVFTQTSDREHLKSQPCNCMM